MTPGTMRQAWYDRTGSAAEVLKTGFLEIPAPGPGEVLVKVWASGINPSDCKQRRGWPGYVLQGRTVPHSDGAGVIAATGPGVDPRKVGSRVWVWGARGGSFYGFDGGPEVGTASDYVCLPVAHTAHLPDHVSFEVGAALGAPACTAHYLVFGDGDVAGKAILVQGGGGAVGSLATAFAARGGATVVATVSSSEKADIARSAGASHVINYRTSDIRETLAELCPDGFDRIIEVDFAANIAVDATVMRRDGVIASYSSPTNAAPTVPYYQLQFKGVTIRFCQGARLPQAAQTNALVAIEQGLREDWLRPVIGSRFALEEIAEAHELVESGKAVGKVIITL